MTTSSNEAWSFEELFKNLAEGKTSAGEPTLPDEGKFPGAEQINPQLEKQKLVKLDHESCPQFSWVQQIRWNQPSKTDRNQVIQFNSWPNIDLPDPWRSLTSPLAIKISGQIELINAPTKVTFSAQFIARDVGWRWSFFFSPAICGLNEGL